ncbi:MAG: endonuclease DNA-(apurinic or apyrimidinic site) lyase [Bacteroidetes bacterium]|nr:endonuclease DNA-(apurinic or apyrimidinic site) lyase [Bacteroidota bacterium]
MSDLNPKYNFIIDYFSKNQPDAASELIYDNPYQLLVAVVLSAQCTDKRVNLITPHIFIKFPTVYDLANASETEIFDLIKSCSYPNNKAKHLLGLAKKIVSDFNGNVPESLDDLITLPGVGRKTANVILSVIYNQPAMAVDTHVFRVSNRLGIVKNSKTPFETEKQLMAHFSPEIIPIAHHWLILHGRYVCIARNPKCEICKLSAICDYYNDYILKTK